MNLKTERLIIRNLRDSDLAAFNAYRSDPEVCRFQGYEPFNTDSSHKFIDEHKANEFGAAGMWAQFAIALNENDLLIGDIGLKADNHDIRIVEFGVSLSRDFQGSGFAREALAAVFHHLFSARAIHRIIGITDTENTGSIKLMERLGFTREGELRQSFYDNGVWRDEYLYALLSGELRQPEMPPK